jgi:hypothetical protein
MGDLMDVKEVLLDYLMAIKANKNEKSNAHIFP